MIGKPPLFRLACFALTAVSFGTSTSSAVIDVHSHNILPTWRQVIEQHGAAMDEGFPIPSWDVRNHLSFMNQAGIEQAVLSMPAPQPYFGDTAESCRTVRAYNEACAALKREYPGRFLFCAALPLPDVEASIREAVYALDSLGADGIKLATNSYGQYVGDESLDALMQVLHERQAVVILHPHKPQPVHAGTTAVTPLAAYEYPAETTRAVVNLLARNVPARYPGIRFVVPHCGSFLPLALPRLKALHPAMVAQGLMEPVDWEANLSRLYYDLAGAATPHVVHALLTITTPDHLLYGSDYPYQPPELLRTKLEELRAWMAEDDTLARYVQDILHNNARRLFSERDLRNQREPSSPSEPRPATRRPGPQHR